jgi:hypothetical protein
MSIYFRKPGQEIGGLALKRDRQSQERFDPDVATVLLDEIDLRSMQPRCRRERFLRQGKRRALLADPLADKPHELARVHFSWPNHPEAVISLNRQSVTPADNAKRVGAA